MAFDIRYLLTFLEEILKTPSPSGYTHLATAKVEAEAKKYDLKTEMLRTGSLMIALPGICSEQTICFAAHIDTLGAMVRSIKANGFVRYSPIGGFFQSTIEGEYCEIFTRDHKKYTGTVLTTKPSHHVYKGAGKLERKEENMEIRLDERVSSKKDVQALGIKSGDFIAFSPRTTITPQKFIKSRYLDDKASVAILVTVMERLAREKIHPQYNTVFYISAGEEIGRGTSVLPSTIAELIVVDIGLVGADLETTEFVASICAKDSSGPYDYKLTDKLIQIATSKEINFAIDIFPQYASDARAALAAGANIQTALIGPGVHATHSIERTHIEALTNTAQLIWEFLTWRDK
jgi:putative aminopeptidase FrvX